jgi:hypothetical protein
MNISRHVTLTAMNIHAQALGGKSGKARAAKLSKSRISEIAARRLRRARRRTQPRRQQNTPQLRGVLALQ